MDSNNINPNCSYKTDLNFTGKYIWIQGVSKISVFLRKGKRGHKNIQFSLSGLLPKVSCVSAN